MSWIIRNLEAIKHCEEAESQLQLLPPSMERSRAELEIQLAKGVAVRAGRGFSAPEAERVFLRACELCEELGDRIRLVHVMRGLFAFYYVAGRWRDAMRVADRMGKAAEGLEDQAARCVRWNVDGLGRLFTGQPGKALDRFKAALRYYDERDRDIHLRLSGHDMAALIRFHIAIAEWLVGLPDTAASTSVDAARLVERVTYPFALAQLLHFHTLFRILYRDWHAAESLAASFHKVGARFGLVTHEASGTLLLGVVAAQADPAEGARLIRTGVAALHRSGAEYLVPLALAHLARALSTCGDAEAALKTAEEALRRTRVNGELVWEPEALRVLGEVRLAAGEREAAEADLLAALDVARHQGAKSFELRAATSLARLLADRGERDQARDLLAPVHAWFTEGFDTPDLRDAEALLAELGA